jgi:hypothetical protein
MHMTSPKLRAAVLCASALLTAAAVPSGSSASPVLTHPTGTSLATGAKVTITNIGITRFKDSGGVTIFECITALTTGPVVSNSGTLFGINIETASTTGTGEEGRCTASFGNVKYTTGVEGGLPWCLTGKSEDKFEIRGGKCTEAARPLKVTLDSTGAGECKYKKSTGELGTFTTDGTGDAVLTIVGQEFTKEAGSLFCPSSYKVEAAMTMETDTSASADPLYIS